jgi:hypothetical protein
MACDPRRKKSRMVDVVLKRGIFKTNLSRLTRRSFLTAASDGGDEPLRNGLPNPTVKHLWNGSEAGWKMAAKIKMANQDISITASIIYNGTRSGQSNATEIVV